MIGEIPELAWVRELFGHRSPRLCRLIDHAVELADLPASDIYTLADFVEPFQSAAENLGLLLVPQFLALEEGSLAIELSESALGRRLSELIDPNEATPWIAAALGDLNAGHFSELIAPPGIDAENRPLSIWRRLPSPPVLRGSGEQILPALTDESRFPGFILPANAVIICRVSPARVCSVRTAIFVQAGPHSMNLLCPNCQKMLTVPEQYAGQLMKCPLCAGTFTVPGLPPAPSAVPSMPAPPPAMPETYPVKTEPPVTTSTTTAPTSPFMAPAGAPPLTSTAATPPPGTSFTGTPPPPPPPSGPLTFSLWIKPEVVRWVAPVAVFLIFVLVVVCPVIGVYPGGQMAASQRAWEVFYGGYSEDANLKEFFHIPTAQELKDNPALKDYRPGWAFLMFDYIALLLLTVAVTIGIAVLPLLNLKLPPNIEPLMQWRWALVAGLNLLVFLVLLVQLLWGFPLEGSIYNADAEKFDALAKNPSRNTPQEMTLKVMKGQASEVVTRTVYLKIIIALHLAAIAGAGLMLALERRGNRPPARIDLVL